MENTRPFTRPTANLNHPMNHGLMMLRQAGTRALDGIPLITTTVLSSCSWPGRSMDPASPPKILQVDTAIEYIVCVHIT